MWRSCSRRSEPQVVGPDLAAALLRQVRDQPVEERVLAAGLDVDPAGTGRVDDEALTGEEGRLPVADLADRVVDALGPRDHVTRVDRVGLAGLQVDRVDRAVAG